MTVTPKNWLRKQHLKSFWSWHLDAATSHLAWLLNLLFKRRLHTDCFVKSKDEQIIWNAIEQSHFFLQNPDSICNSFIHSIFYILSIIYSSVHTCKWYLWNKLVLCLHFKCIIYKVSISFCQNQMKRKLTIFKNLSSSTLHRESERSYLWNLHVIKASFS